MYLRAGVFSLGLLLLSRVLGLLRESAQAAAFGSTGVGDAVIVMFTLPDLLVGMVFSGALSYVLLPWWALQSPAEQQRSQKKVAYALGVVGVLLGGVVWLLRDVLVQALAPGLQGALKTMGSDSLLWSALALPPAMLAALWTTRLQHERDFVGVYAGSLLVNTALVAGVLVVTRMGWSGSALTVLGGALLVGGGGSAELVVSPLTEGRSGGASSPGGRVTTAAQRQHLAVGCAVVRSAAAATAARQKPGFHFRGGRFGQF